MRVSIFAVMFFSLLACSSNRVDSSISTYFQYGLPVEATPISEDLKWKLVDAAAVLRANGHKPLFKLETRSLIRIIEWGNGTRMVITYVADGLSFIDLEKLIGPDIHTNRYRSLPSAALGFTFILLEWRLLREVGHEYELGFIEISHSDKSLIIDQYFTGE